MTTRREFLKSSIMTSVAAAAGVAGAPQFAFGQSTNGKTLVKVFMRGGADGLHLFPPIGDMMLYSEYRPNLAIEPPNQLDSNSSLDLGHSYRAMNPNLEPLMEIWNDGRMMVAPATALLEGTGSHFVNQRWIGTGATNDIIDGYLNRYLQLVDGPDHPIRGAVLGKTSISTEMRGEFVVPAVANAESFDLRHYSFCGGDDGCLDNQMTTMLRDITSESSLMSSAESMIRQNQLVMLDSIATVGAAADGYVTSAGGLEYSDGALGRGLKLVAQLLKSDVPLEVAAMDWNIGWDTHSAQIASGANPFTNQYHSYHSNMRSGAQDFLTFYRDISSLIDDVVVVVGTEFGRTVRENGSNGTDHAHAGAWFAFGGATTPGIGPDISSLDPTGLAYYGNGVPMATNYKDVMAEIMVRHMNMPEGLVSEVFPGHQFYDHRLFSRIA